MSIMSVVRRSNEVIKQLNLLGFALVEIDLNNTHLLESNIIIQLGIGTPLIQNILELYRKEIVGKTKGNSIIPMKEYIIYIQYYPDNLNQLISLLIYLNSKEVQVNYSKFYLVSKKIISLLKRNLSYTETLESLSELIEIPKVSEVQAVFILNSYGSPLFSIVNEDYIAIKESDVHISGFISALSTFCQEILKTKSSGNVLKEISFGDFMFYIINKNNIIFAFLIEGMNETVKRYIYLTADFFLQKYGDHIMDFDGEVSIFEDFKAIINNYFKFK
ncbi:MAG: hypothetical protein ACTSR8_15665 [Promethearchaeota archaeon]